MKMIYDHFETERQVCIETIKENNTWGHNS
jgi:hypothetical protein